MSIILVSLWFTRKSNKNPEAFFLGQRGLGPWVAALSAEASDMSGWLLMGLPGVAYFTGMGEAFWTALGLAVGTWINWKVVAKRLRSYTQIAGNAFTLPTFFSNRFHDKRRVLTIIAAITIIVFFSIYVGAQFVTFGKLFNYIFNRQDYYTLMVILGAILVLLYTLLGGFLGESVTDTIQGILMMSVLVLVLGLGLSRAGGISAIMENLGQFPRFMDIFGIAVPVDAQGIPVSGNTVQAVINEVPSFGPGADYSFLNIVSCLAWGLGYFGMPQVLVRFMAIKKSSKIGESRIIAVSWCVISLISAVLIGVIGRAYLPSLLTSSGTAENIFLHLTMHFFPPLFAGLVLSAILAASMSSADSYMLIASSALANDLLKDTFNKNLSEDAVMWLARITMFIITIFGIGVALSGNESIFRIVSYAWAGFGAAFGPLVLFSLFWKRTTFAGAVAGMLTGGIMVIVWKEGISKLGGLFAVYELLPAFILSSLVIFVVSQITPTPSAAIEEEFEKARTTEF